LKKRTKKLLFLEYAGSKERQGNKSFLLLFFKKEVLPYFNLPGTAIAAPWLMASWRDMLSWMSHARQIAPDPHAMGFANA